MQQMIFIADLIAYSTCFGHHYAHHQELESIIQVDVALPVVFGALVFKLSIWCGAECCMSGLRAAASVGYMFQPIYRSSSGPPVHVSP